MGVEVTQGEREHLLGAAETVNHGSQLLAVQHSGVLVLPHTEMSSQQAQSSLVIFWHFLHTKRILDHPT